MKGFIYSITDRIIKIKGVNLFLFLLMVVPLFGLLKGVHLLLLLTIMVPPFASLIVFIFLYMKAIRFKTNSEKITAVVTRTTDEQSWWILINLEFFFLLQFCDNQRLKKKYKEAYKEAFKKADPLKYESALLYRNSKYEYTVQFRDKENVCHTAIIRDLIAVERGDNIDILYDFTNPQESFRTLQHAFLPAIPYFVGFIMFTFLVLLYLHVS